MTLDETAIYYHEMYESFVRAGFSEDQALSIVVAAVTAAVQYASVFYRHG